MVEADWGRIVRIASIAGKEGNPNASGYSASKADMIGLTKSLAKELAKTGLLVSAVMPAARPVDRTAVARPQGRCTSASTIVIVASESTVETATAAVLSSCATR